MVIAYKRWFTLRNRNHTICEISWRRFGSKPGRDTWHWAWFEVSFSTLKCLCLEPAYPEREICDCRKCATRWFGGVTEPKFWKFPGHILAPGDQQERTRHINVLLKSVEDILNISELLTWTFAAWNVESWAPAGCRAAETNGWWPFERNEPAEPGQQHHRDDMSDTYSISIYIHAYPLD